MPYFDKKLLEEVQELCLWADLRHEQGAKVKPLMKKLRKEIASIRRGLEHGAPRKKTAQREPNELDAIKALRPDGPRRVWPRLQKKGLAKRMKGAWLGRAAGCTLGAPVEGWPIEKMEALAQESGDAFPPTDYWSAHPEPERLRYNTSRVREYLRGRMRAVPVDDDVTYTVLGLLILEQYGPAFTTADVGRAWVQLLPLAYTAEHVALENLRAGVPADEAGATRNPYQEWIGADIRSDPWAYAAPGWPERAAEMAYRDAYLSHRHNGIYGAMFFAAAIAAAFAVDDPLDALRIGLTEIPERCRLADDVRWALDTGGKLADWREARAAVDERFAGMHPVHTNNNACLTVFGLMLGGKDMTKTLGMTVAMGLDNDCTAATAGSLLGAVIGADGIPAHWWRPFRNRTLTYLHGHESFINTDVVSRFVAVAEKVWAEPAPAAV